MGECAGVQTRDGVRGTEQNQALAWVWGQRPERCPRLGWSRGTESGEMVGLEQQWGRVPAPLWCLL